MSGRVSRSNFRSPRERRIFGVRQVQEQNAKVCFGDSDVRQPLPAFTFIVEMPALQMVPYQDEQTGFRFEVAAVRSTTAGRPGRWVVVPGHAITGSWFPVVVAR